MQLFLVVRVELVAVAMALVNPVHIAVEVCGFGAGEKNGLAGAESHRCAHVFDALLFFLKADDWVLGGFVEFRGIRVLQTADIPCELDGGDLHAETDAEIRDFLLTRVLGGEDFSLDASVAKTAGDENSVHISNHGSRAVIFDGLGFHADDLDLGVVVGTGVDQGFINGFIGVLEFDVFSSDGDGDLVLGVDDALHKALPILKGG